MKNLVKILILITTLSIIYFTENHFIALTMAMLIVVFFWKKNKQDVEEQKEQLQCILEHLPICAFMKNRKDEFIIGSSAFEKVINNNQKGVKYLSIYDVFDKEYVELVKREEKEIYRTKQRLETEREVVFPKQTFWGRIHKAPIFDKRGEVKALIVMYENIDTKKQVEKQREYFIETLIHNLKIPTIAQLRGLEFLEKNSEKISVEEKKELYFEIKNSCKGMLDMISKVLNAYRLENGDETLYFSDVNLENLLSRYRKEINPLLKEKELTLKISNPTNVIIKCDENALLEVLKTLTTNAIIYSDKGESIELRIIDNQSKLKFEIVSHGITMSTEEQMTMFNNLQRDNATFTTVGYGIGLYLCKKIVDMHNGQIYASTNGDNTNIFTFEIPL